MSLISSVNYPNKRIYLSIETINKELDTVDIYKELEVLRSTTPYHQLFSPLMFFGGNEEIIPNVSFTEPFVKLVAGARIVPYDTNHTLKLITTTFTEDGFEGRDCFDRTSLTSIVDIDVEIKNYKLLEPDTSMVSSAVWNTPYATLTNASTIGAKLNSSLNTITTNTNTIISDINSIPTDVKTELNSSFNDLTTNINTVITELSTLPQDIRTELTPELTHISTLQNGLGLDSTQALMLLEIYKLYGLDPTKPLVVTPTSRTIGTDIVQSIDSNGTRTIISRT